MQVSRVARLAFGPEDFALLDAVFQVAWHQIEDRYVEDDRKASRERLASIVVALAQARGVLESEALEKAAIETFIRRKWAALDLHRRSLQRCKHVCWIR